MDLVGCDRKFHSSEFHYFFVQCCPNYLTITQPQNPTWKPRYVAKTWPGHGLFSFKQPVIG